MKHPVHFVSYCLVVFRNVTMDYILLTLLFQTVSISGYELSVLKSGTRPNLKIDVEHYLRWNQLEMTSSE